MLLRVTPHGAALAADWTASYELAAEELFRPLTPQKRLMLVDMLRTLSSAGEAAAGD